MCRKCTVVVELLDDHCVFTLFCKMNVFKIYFKTLKNYV